MCATVTGPGKEELLVQASQGMGLLVPLEGLGHILSTEQNWWSPLHGQEGSFHTPALPTSKQKPSTKASSQVCSDQLNRTQVTEPHSFSLWLIGWHNVNCSPWSTLETQLRPPDTALTMPWVGVGKLGICFNLQVREVTENYYYIPLSKNPFRG